MKQYVYLSGPMGTLSYAEMADWRRYVIERLESDEVKCLDPTRSMSSDHRPYETNKWINRRDFNDCVRAQVCFVNLQGMKTLSIGTIMEIAWAYQKQIPVIAVVDKDGPQNHPMLQDSITQEVNSLDEGITFTKELLATRDYQPKA